GGLFFVMAVLRGAGDSRTPFIYLAMAVALDIGLNPVLIFGWGPVPRLGIAGSALATLIAQGVSFAALVLHLYRVHHFLCIRRNELRLFIVDWSLVRLLVTKGVPMGLQMFVVSSSMIALMAVIYSLDRAALGLFLPAQGTALALAVHLNAIVLWSFVLFGVSLVLYGVVRATGAVVPPLIMLALALWGIRVPFAYALVDHWQADAIWWSFPVASIASVTMASLYYQYGNWRKVQLGIAQRREPVPSA